jgi:NADH:ubiquinone oxidoreductase subunit F (NADH-binding)
VDNNVETLANVPLILRDGGEAFARIGTDGSTGPKLFCLSGNIERAGVYEVDRGDLGELIASWRCRRRSLDAGHPAWRRGLGLHRA